MTAPPTTLGGKVDRDWLRAEAERIAKMIEERGTTTRLWPARALAEVTLRLLDELDDLRIGEAAT